MNLTSFEIRESERAGRSNRPLGLPKSLCCYIKHQLSSSPRTSNRSATLFVLTQVPFWMYWTALR